ncbi:tyrosine-type recombinase/integrase [Sphingomonas sp. 179-I 2A4 NHS]|uniref:tyrosine-type recombinase/integrase n=1 Tax=unclassified Sphingomonas TaxID=196159 RepID=UPI0038791A46
MATGKITKTSVDAAGTGFLWDSEVAGFGLRVTAAGARSYVFQYRMGGREVRAQRVTIGPHGSWTPDKARTEAKRLRVLVDQGVNPAEQDRERRRQAVDLAFDVYAALFVKSALKNDWKDWAAGERLLMSEAVPVLRAKPLLTIKRSDIAAVLDRLADRPASARLAHATMRKMFKWAEGRGDIERSPMDGMKAPATVAARDRVLSDRELALVWKAANDLAYPFGPLFRLLILTGQRREEVAGLEWQELDRATATWDLPARRAKNGQAHIVPLSRAALGLLDELAAAVIEPRDGEPIQWPRRRLVFTTTGKTAVSGYSKAKARLDATIAAMEARAAADESREPETVPAWRTHDLRRTVATGLQRLGVRFEVTEAVLNHVSGSKSGIAGVYQRHDWKEEKREALAAWAAHVADLQQGKS